MSADRLRLDFRAAVRDVRGVDADEWTPRELRHSFVSAVIQSGATAMNRRFTSNGSWFGSQPAEKTKEA